MDITSIIPTTPQKPETQLVAQHLSRARRIARNGVLITGLMVVPMFAWVTFAPLASAVIATGHVKVDLDRALVQHVEGGTVRAVLVRDGQKVKKGQALIELGDVSVNADQTRLRQRLLSERAGQARLEAEQLRRQVLVFPTELVESARTDAVLREQLVKEQALFNARLTTLNQGTSLLRKQRETIQREMVSLRDASKSAQDSIAVQTRELELRRRMAAEGLTSDSQVMQSESSIADYRGKIAQHAADLARADQRIGDIDLRLSGMANDYSQQASDQLRLTSVRIQEIEQELRKATDAQRRQVITAPIDGEVIGLRVSSPGAVLVPREPIAEIVPANPRLVVEAQIDTKDIARVHKGQHADVRLSAFTYRTTDMAKGTVSYVGADRMVQKDTGRPYYTVKVDVAPESVKQAVKGAEAPNLQAGMPVEVYVRGEERTALGYLLEPLTMVMNRAGREH